MGGGDDIAHGMYFKIKNVPKGMECWVKRIVFTK